jgi:TolA-binding protein
MSAADRAVLEERLLGEASAATPRRPVAARWRRGGALLALSSASAIAAVVIVAQLHVREVRRQTTSLASVRAVGATTFSRLRPPPDEVLRLDAGILDVTVVPSEDGRRVRVETDDASIDVSAGRFRAEASAHMLVAVRVFAGAAYVATKGERAALHAGDEWARAPAGAGTNPITVAAASAPKPSLVAPAPPAAPVPPIPASRRPPHRRDLASSSEATRPAPARETPSQPVTTAVAPRASFERGWSLLRSGDPAGAAVAFGEVGALAAGDAIAEDALFWRAVSLARTSQKAEARAAMGRFLVVYPESARFGEASALLGWMLLESGDRDGARRAFERAARDRVDRVRKSAASGLEKLEVSPSPASK